MSARLLGVANAPDGLPRGQAARLAGLDGKTLQRWIERFNAEAEERYYATMEETALVA